MKQELRQKILKLRNEFDKDKLLEFNLKIKQNLLSLKEFINSDVICSYVSFKSEVNTHNIIKKSINLGKKVVVPYIKNEEIYLSELNDFNNLEQGQFGILEPKKEFIKSVDKSIVEIFIIPGLAFDKSGNRIGYGGGYYDRLLKDLNVLKIALCYEFQLLENLPNEDHDIPVDIIITEKQIIRVE
ncbi:5-formyltetrahydrofolate cyclo-ligase [archaeon]|jgi:5-formyltetrahydrofolate cyclo-ligase|nr:5-formyltetrahydrofolate cyclo-ligase [archaeon]